MQACIRWVAEAKKNSMDVSIEALNPERTPSKNWLN